ncbi:MULTISPECIES: ABC transporter permease [Butyricimonas]|uniref:ABC transporter permease n=1 Tax=Butyricimonas TaxID=574697 RepID=UPI0011DE48EA|nr:MULTISPECIES: hypothetical protein [Butyricimonas]
MDGRNIKYLASFFPYMNVFLFTLFQTLPLVVAASSFLNKSQKIDTMEVIYYHPASNAEHVWGTFLGFSGIFGLTAVISTVLGVLTRVNAGYFFFSLLLDYFYLFTLLVPTIVFLTGLSFWVNSWIKNQILCQLLLLSYVGLTLYTVDYGKGILDFWGMTLPATFSDFTGHPNLGHYLLQRGSWLCLGLGLIQVTVLRFERLPNTPIKGREKGLATVLLALGIISLFSFWTINHANDVSRQKYIATYDKYESHPKGSLVSQSIHYTQRGDKMSVNSELMIRNSSDTEIQELLLYLNPSLQVTSLSSENGELPFERENQVVRVKYTLTQGDSLRIYITYKGQIDENICYLDIPLEELEETSKKAYGTCRYGKRYAFLEREYTLLIPEALWYPVTVPPVNSQTRFKVSKNLSHYTLQVELPKGQTVISQGRRSRVGQDIVFKNDIPLTGISLCMGNYITKRIEMDSTVYELNILREHKKLLHALWNDKKVPAADMIFWVREKAERVMGKRYPYTRFILTETPISFTSYSRNERGGSGLVQPELLFFAENGLGIGGTLLSARDMKYFFNSFFFKKEKSVTSFSWNKLLGIDYLRNLRHPYLPSGRERIVPNNYYIGPLFYNQSVVINSSTYAYIDPLINVILQDNNLSQEDRWQKFNSKLEEEAIYYTRTHNLKEAFEDKSLRFEVLNVLMTLKGRELVGLFDTKGVVIDSVISFIARFQDRYQFQEVDFDVLEREFAERFGVSWSDVLRSWIEKKGVPQYLVKGEKSYLVKTPYGEKWRRKFAIFNDSEVDGIVFVKTFVLTVGKEFLPVEEAVSNLKNTTEYKAYEIKANSGIEVVAHEKYNLNLKINLLLNIARNLPREEFLIGYHIYHEDTIQYTRAIGKDYFISDSNEIIVDNEDANFKIIQSGPRIRLGDYFHEKSLKPWEKYVNLSNEMIFVTDKWKWLANSGYGKIVKSHLIKQAGTGKKCLEWNTRLDKKGKYEIFVTINGSYIPRLSEPQNQYYFLINGNKEHELQLLDVLKNEGQWRSLGVFDLQAGTCKLILTDKGIEGQTIDGDAVKWIYLGEND